jgi:cysteine synthase
MRFEDVAGMVGRTPHLRVRCDEVPPSAQIYVKLEGTNPTGSVKDRACLGIIRALEREGRLPPRPNKVTLLDASSGNFACAVAFYGKLLGHPATVVVNSKLTTDKRNFLQFFGAEIIQVGDFTIEGNRYCREVLAPERPDDYLFLDQLHNWANPRAYYDSMGPEILSDFPDVAMVVGSLGSGGTMTGVGQFLKEHRPETKVVAVQAAPGTKIPGTGAFDDGDYVTPFIKKSREDGVFDLTVKINEADAVRRVAQLRDQGIFGGIQTGGVLHAAALAVGQLSVRGEVVIISGDTGWKNMDKLLQLRI